MRERTGRLVTILSGCALLTAGCTIGTTEPAVVALEATVVPLSGGAGPRASVAALTEGSNTRTSILLQFGEPGTAYGWRIRTGGCSQSGSGQVGGLAAYPDLTAGMDGSATADGTLAVRLLSGERYHAVIVDPQDETRTLACGSLQRPSS
jgi:hypothetical protein